MNHHPHPPHARAKKRLSLGKEVDKRGVSEKESFSRKRAGKHHAQLCLNYILSLKISNLNTEN
jgi:hypothetical protein